VSKLIDVLWVVVMALCGAVSLTALFNGDRIDGAIIFLVFVVGYRVNELHLKVDKLLKSKDDPPIK
jgi:hypothetical protein